jgi:hypothetical protein
MEYPAVNLRLAVIGAVRVPRSRYPASRHLIKNIEGIQATVARSISLEA